VKWCIPSYIPSYIHISTYHPLSHTILSFLIQK
jgi:hypothetical protein